jgi:hypothetical protein
LKVTLSCAGCHSRVAINCAQKSFKKLCKNVDGIATWCQPYQYFMSSFLYESFWAAFVCLQFGFLNFWRKDFSAKAAHKMLVKSAPGGRNWQRFTLFSSIFTFSVLLSICSFVHYG